MNTRQNYLTLTFKPQTYYLPPKPSTNMKKAILIGATGATGKDLVQVLLQDAEFSEVHVFVRKPLDFKNPKLKVHVVDFTRMEEWKDLINGNVAFSTMGTTLKQAGSKEAQRIVDFDYQFHFAKYAKENGIPHFVLLSAYGADAKSMLFYNKMKGDLEEAVQKLDFDYLTIFQPGILDRKNSDRTMEVIGLKVIKFFTNLGLFTSQKPMPTEVLAKAMVKASKLNTKKISFISLNKIFDYA